MTFAALSGQPLRDGRGTPPSPAPRRTRRRHAAAARTAAGAVGAEPSRRNAFRNVLRRCAIPASTTRQSRADHVDRRVPARDRPHHDRRHLRPGPEHRGRHAARDRGMRPIGHPHADRSIRLVAGSRRQALSHLPLHHHDEAGHGGRVLEHREHEWDGDVVRQVGAHDPAAGRSPGSVASPSSARRSAAHARTGSRRSPRAPAPASGRLDGEDLGPARANATVSKPAGARSRPRDRRGPAASATMARASWGRSGSSGPADFVGRMPCRAPQVAQAGGLKAGRWRGSPGEPDVENALGEGLEDGGRPPARSMILPGANGPRSSMTTVTERPVSRSVTVRACRRARRDARP